MTKTHTSWTRHADAYKYACKLHKAWKTCGVTFSIKRRNDWTQRWIVEAVTDVQGHELRALVKKNPRLRLPAETIAHNLALPAR